MYAETALLCDWAADDVIPIPVFGMPYNNSQILTVFVKYCKKQARDMKDVMIMTVNAPRPRHRRLLSLFRTFSLRLPHNLELA